ncbi:substance-K receptor-like [Glandiceps talaboti]
MAEWIFGEALCKLVQYTLKTIRTLISIVILFAICWLPVNLYNLVLVTYNPEYLETHRLTADVIRACSYIWPILSDSIFNPIVYVFLSDEFRSDMSRFCCHWKFTLLCDSKLDKPTVRSPSRRSAQTETLMLNPM